MAGLVSGGMLSPVYASSIISLDKAYTFTPDTNYGLTKSSSDSTLLTDGVYTFGHFWTKPTTAGWQESGTIEIIIDLEAVFRIDVISFNTARGGHAGVSYPTQVFAFTGETLDSLHYVGDVVSDKENIAGSTFVRKFSLVLNGSVARYVVLEVVPGGKYTFCDEIEILGSVDLEHLSPESAGSSLKDVRNFVDKLKGLKRKIEFLYKRIGKVRSVVNDDSKLNDQLIEIERAVARASTIQEFRSLEIKLMSINAEALRLKHDGQQYILTTVSPWTPASKPETPLETTVDSLTFSMPSGGVDWHALMLTNLSENKRAYDFTVNVLPPNAPNINLYQAITVQSAAMEEVPDALMPISESVSLYPGESRMILLSAQGALHGEWGGIFQVSSESLNIKIPLSLRTEQVNLHMPLTINSVVWDYLYFPPIRNQQQLALEDLRTHHINVTVVPQMYIPLLGDKHEISFDRLTDYLKLQKGVDKVLLFTYWNDLKRLDFNGSTFLSKVWKLEFLTWCEGIFSAAEKAGFRRQQIYLYPFDEMKRDIISHFIDLAKWARGQVPALQFYATIDNVDALNAIPFLDIAQIKNMDKIVNQAINFSRISKTELWLYDSHGPAKSNSPYDYYRLQPWKAFSLGYTGVGFWSYADIGWGESVGTAWNDFDGRRPDFAVIYEGKDGSLISSRRWEAWRIGLEDYQLLSLYAQRKGSEAALALAESVLKDMDKTWKADIVRSHILNELSKQLEELN
ncbi:MAG: DUF4091 domain-containing protein [Desulfuromonadales bacterium]|nr:DUF4091 domain-containing protein [Desulfuromonadales bacterium]